MDKLRSVHLRVMSNYWGAPVRSKDGNLEVKKGECWGVLCSVSDALENAKILIERAKKGMV